MFYGVSSEPCHRADLFMVQRVILLVFNFIYVRIAKYQRRFRSIRPLYTNISQTTEFVIRPQASTLPSPFYCFTVGTTHPRCFSEFFAFSATHKHTGCTKSLKYRKMRELQSNKIFQPCILFGRPNVYGYKVIKSTY